jgi:hypothetical protein
MGGDDVNPTSVKVFDYSTSQLTDVRRLIRGFCNFLLGCKIVLFRVRTVSTTTSRTRVHVAINFKLGMFDVCSVQHFGDEFVSISQPGKKRMEGKSLS